VDAAAPCTLEPAFPKEHPVSHRTPQSRPNPKIEERRLEIASPQFSPAYQEVYSQEAASPFIPVSRVICHVDDAPSRIIAGGSPSRTAGTAVVRNGAARKHLTQRLKHSARNH
jgi:hypothetical protein